MMFIQLDAQATGLTAPAHTAPRAAYPVAFGDRSRALV